MTSVTVLMVNVAKVYIVISLCCSVKCMKMHDVKSGKISSLCQEMNTHYCHVNEQSSLFIHLPIHCCVPFKSASAWYVYALVVAPSYLAAL